MEASICPLCERLQVDPALMRRPDHGKPPLVIVTKECWACRVAKERVNWMRYEAERRGTRP